VGPDTGSKRPAVCIGIGDGTCPPEWLARMVECFAAGFDGDVTVNDPFRGGWITRFHSQEMPWIQLELSRAPGLTPGEKRERVLTALQTWVSGI
jgi:N-formylglutamate amidohydrolase